MRSLMRPAAWSRPLSQLGHSAGLASSPTVAPQRQAAVSSRDAYRPMRLASSGILPLKPRRAFSSSPARRLQPPKTPDSKPDDTTDTAKPLESQFSPARQPSPSDDGPKSRPTLEPGTVTTPSSTESSDAHHSSSAVDASKQGPASDASQPLFSTSPSSEDSSLKTSIPRLIDSLQARLLTASQTLNDLTGYTSIEAIKSANTDLETALQTAHQSLRSARQKYKTATALRASTQRETTTLLARKESWSPQDLERFTELYRRDHTLDQEVARAGEALNEAEAEEQRLSQDLVAGMLRRYHEEQIWSDRIRRASTWGTWGLMGVNVLLFVLLQFVAEPWRRRRLVRAVVEEEKGVLEGVRGEMEAVRGALARAQQQQQQEEEEAEQGDETRPLASGLTGAAEEELLLSGDGDGGAATHVPVTVKGKQAEGEQIPAEPIPWTRILSDPNIWRARVSDLCSERRIDLRMRDASVLALQSAVAGAAVAGSVVLLLVRRT